MQLELIDCSCRHPAASADSTPAVKAINLKVQRGEQLAVIGPSGAGKTTLLQLLCCALKPTAGRYLLDDQNPWEVSRHELARLRRNLFLAPQVPPLPPRQRVVTSVLAGRLPSMGFWTSMRSLFYPIGIRDAREALAQYDLAEKLFERVDRLSGGERQRVGLARGLVSQANLFLIDEPLSALDPSRATIAMKALTGSASARNATLVATLHQVDTALKYFPRIVGMRSGEVFFDLPVQEVSARLLEELYAHHLDELDGPAPEVVYPPSTPRPVPMQCR